jgi:uncharacterized membrane protein
MSGRGVAARAAAKAAARAAGGRGGVAVPVWVWAVPLALAVAGLAVAGYLTVEHYTAATTLACPERGTVNCQKVTTSAQSRFLGVPVAVWGLVYFAGIAVLDVPAAWRSRHPALRWGRLAAATGGVCFVLWLLYAELFVIDAICLWCTAVHAIALGVFAAVALGTAATSGEE